MSTTEGIAEPRGAAAPREPHLFLVLGAKDPFAAAGRARLGAVDEVVIGRAHARSVTTEGPRLAVRLPDASLSATHARVTSASGSWFVEDCGSKNGTVVNGARVERAELRDGDLIEVGSSFFLYRAGLPARPSDPAWMQAPPVGLPTAGLATLDPALEDTFRLLRNAAASSVPVVLHGATGTGKEMVARAMHELSGRSGELVPVNCGAIPASLVESELFGHKRGAFSGATEARLGLLRTAHKGTLFLDEIGDLAPAGQVALLRALQEGEVRPVGADEPVHVDVRVIAASHKSLPDLVEHGQFREDLYARLHFVVTLPSLVERRADLGMAIRALLDRAGVRRGDIAFHPYAARALLLHSWPRNLRELEKTLGVALALARAAGVGVIETEHLPAELVRPPPAPVAPAAQDDRRAQLVELLRAHGGNVSRVAQELRTSRAQVLRLAKRYGIVVESYRR